MMLGLTGRLTEVQEIHQGRFWCQVAVHAQTWGWASPPCSVAWWARRRSSWRRNTWAPFSKLSIMDLLSVSAVQLHLLLELPVPQLLLEASCCVLTINFGCFRIKQWCLKNYSMWLNCLLLVFANWDCQQPENYDSKLRASLVQKEISQDPLSLQWVVFILHYYFCSCLHRDLKVPMPFGMHTTYSGVYGRL